MFGDIVLSVYPRVYGGTSRRPKRGSRPTGLSPRVRGNQCARAISVLTNRSIPACTGEPAWGVTHELLYEVYPRVYGGTPLFRVGYKICLGLSPRVRGNRRESLRICANRRSIPACTGEPFAHATARIIAEVYPRVYGGTGRIQIRKNFYHGLSPRVRGNLYAF